MDQDMQPPHDATWQAAWAWVQRQHETPDLPATDQAALVAWLNAAPAHWAAYERASKVWLMTGLVPPVNDIDLPDSEDR